MKKYLHYTTFAVNADCILTDNYDETKRGYTLYAEIEAENLTVILKHLQEVYGFTIKGENVGTSAYCFVDFIRGLPDDESTIKESFRLIRHINGRKTELTYRLLPDENKVSGKHLAIYDKGDYCNPFTRIEVTDTYPNYEDGLVALFKTDGYEKVLDTIYEMECESSLSHLTISRFEHIRNPRNVVAWVRDCLETLKQDEGVEFVEISV